VLMRDLVGQDRRPVSFLVYLWLTSEQACRRGAVQVSYRELAESIGLSKISAQVAASWLVGRELLTANKENATAIPRLTPCGAHGGMLHSASASAPISDLFIPDHGLAGRDCGHKSGSRTWPVISSNPVLLSCS
jgi:hypothetical protein